MRVSWKKSMILKRGYGGRSSCPESDRTKSALYGTGLQPPGIRCGKRLLQTHIYLLPHLAKHSVPHTEGKTN